MEHSYFKEEPQPLIIDETAKGYFREIAGWAKFLAISGFIFLGLFVILGIMFAMSMSALYANSPLGAFTGYILSVVYILLACIYIYPTYALYKFAVLSKRSLLTDSRQEFNTAISYLKGMFKYIGVIMIVVLGIYLLVFVFIIIGASLAGMHH